MKDGWYRIKRKWIGDKYVSYLTAREAREYAADANDYTIEPVIVMTQVEYDALTNQPHPEGSRPSGAGVPSAEVREAIENLIDDVEFHQGRTVDIEVSDELYERIFHDACAVGISYQDVVICAIEYFFKGTQTAAPNAMPAPNWDAYPWANWHAVNADNTTIFSKLKPLYLSVDSYWHEPMGGQTAHLNAKYTLPLGIDWRLTLRPRDATGVQPR